MTGLVRQHLGAAPVPAPRLGAGSPARNNRLARQTGRQVAALEQQTVVRAAAVQAESIVQHAKLREMDRLGREAITGQVFLQRWAATLAQGDPFLADDCRFFLDTVKLAKGEIIADTIDTYCDESRRYR